MGNRTRFQISEKLRFKIMQRFKQPDNRIEKIAEDLEIPMSTVNRVLDAHFKQAQKKMAEKVKD